MTPQERYDLIQESMQAFNPFYREAIQAVFADYEIQGRDWFFAYLAYGLEPDPLTAGVLQQMTPYANPQTQAERLLETADKGFLEAAADNDYRLTAAGRAPVEAFFSAARQAIGPLTRCLRLKLPARRSCLRRSSPAPKQPPRRPSKPICVSAAAPILVLTPQQLPR